MSLFGGASKPSSGMAVIEDRSGLTKLVIGHSIQVHKSLGPGLLEDTYERCLRYDLENAGILVRAQVQMPLVYRNLKLPFAYRIDLLVEEKLIVEVKAVEKLTSLHTAQLLTYLKISGLDVGLLMNFNTKVLRHDMRRVLNPHKRDPSLSRPPSLSPTSAFDEQ